MGELIEPYLLCSRPTVSTMDDLGRIQVFKPALNELELG